MQSLADYLGTAPPKVEEGPSLLDAEGATAEEFAAKFLSSIEFRKYLVNSLTLGDIPAAIVTRMMDYAPGWGKPVERIEIDDRREQFEGMSKRALLERIALMQALVNELPDDGYTLH